MKTELEEALSQPQHLYDEDGFALPKDKLPALEGLHLEGQHEQSDHNPKSGGKGGGKAKYDKPNAKLVKEALDLYGTTQDIDSASWVFSNGVMAQFGGFDNHSKVIELEAIKNSDRVKDAMESKDLDEYNAALEEFMLQTHAVRVATEDTDLNVQLIPGNTLSDTQQRIIRDFVNEREGQVRIDVVSESEEIYFGAEGSYRGVGGQGVQQAIQEANDFSLSKEKLSLSQDFDAVHFEERWSKLDEQKLHLEGQHDQADHNPHGGGGGKDKGSKDKAGKGRDTQAKYFKDGKWDPDRVATVHEPALAKLTDGVRKTDGPGVLYMTGGGYGSGKSSVLEDPAMFPAKGEAVRVDPDALKHEIPEYDPFDPASPSQVHEESSHLGKEGVRRCLSEGYDVTYDTSGDGRIEGLRDKVQSFRDAGASRVEGHYVFPGSVAEAQARVVERAERTGRYIDPELVAINHADVSRAWQDAAAEGLYDHLTLHDTSGPLGSEPTLVAEARNGEITVHDEVRFANFTAVASSP